MGNTSTKTLPELYLSNDLSLKNLLLQLNHNVPIDQRIIDKRDEKGKLVDPEPQQFAIARDTITILSAKRGDLQKLATFLTLGGSLHYTTVLGRNAYLWSIAKQHEVLALYMYVSFKEMRILQYLPQAINSATSKHLYWFLWFLTVHSHIFKKYYLLDNENNMEGDNIPSISQDTISNNIHSSNNSNFRHPTNENDIFFNKSGDLLQNDGQCGEFFDLKEVFSAHNPSPHYMKIVLDNQNKNENMNTAIYSSFHEDYGDESDEYRESIGTISDNPESAVQEMRSKFGNFPQNNRNETDSTTLPLIPTSNSSNSPKFPHTPNRSKSVNLSFLKFTKIELFILQTYINALHNVSSPLQRIPLQFSSTGLQSIIYTTIIEKSAEIAKKLINSPKIKSHQIPSGKFTQNEYNNYQYWSTFYSYTINLLNQIDTTTKSLPPPALISASLQYSQLCRQEVKYNPQTHHFELFSQCFCSGNYNPNTNTNICYFYPPPISVPQLPLHFVDFIDPTHPLAIGYQNPIFSLKQQNGEKKNGEISIKYSKNDIFQQNQLILPQYKAEISDLYDEFNQKNIFTNTLVGPNRDTIAVSSASHLDISEIDGMLSLLDLPPGHNPHHPYNNEQSPKPSTIRVNHQKSPKSSTITQLTPYIPHIPDDTYSLTSNILSNPDYRNLFSANLTPLHPTPLASHTHPISAHQCNTSLSLDGRAFFAHIAPELHVPHLTQNSQQSAMIMKNPDKRICSEHAPPNILTALENVSPLHITPLTTPLYHPDLTSFLTHLQTPFSYGPYPLHTVFQQDPPIRSSYDREIGLGLSPFDPGYTEYIKKMKKRAKIDQNTHQKNVSELEDDDFIVDIDDNGEECGVIELSNNSDDDDLVKTSEFARLYRQYCQHLAHIHGSVLTTSFDNQLGTISYSSPYIIENTSNENREQFQKTNFSQAHEKDGEYDNNQNLFCLKNVKIAQNTIEFNSPLLHTSATSNLFLLSSMHRVIQHKSPHFTLLLEWYRLTTQMSNFLSKLSQYRVNAWVYQQETTVLTKLEQYVLEKNKQIETKLNAFTTSSIVIEAQNSIEDFLNDSEQSNNGGNIENIDEKIEKNNHEEKIKLREYSQYLSLYHSQLHSYIQARISTLSAAKQYQGHISSPVVHILGNIPSFYGLDMAIFQKGNAHAFNSTNIPPKVGAISSTTPQTQGQGNTEVECNRSENVLKHFTPQYCEALLTNKYIPYDQEFDMIMTSWKHVRSIALSSLQKESQNFNKKGEKMDQDTTQANVPENDGIMTSYTSIHPVIEKALIECYLSYLVTSINRFLTQSLQLSAELSEYLVHSPVPTRTPVKPITRVAKDQVPSQQPQQQSLQPPSLFFPTLSNHLIMPSHSEIECSLSILSHLQHQAINVKQWLVLTHAYPNNTEKQAEIRRKSPNSINFHMNLLENGIFYPSQHAQYYNYDNNIAKTHISTGTPSNLATNQHSPQEKTHLTENVPVAANNPLAHLLVDNKPTIIKKSRLTIPRSAALPPTISALNDVKSDNFQIEKNSQTCNITKTDTLNHTTLTDHTFSYNNIYNPSNVIDHITLSRVPSQHSHHAPPQQITEPQSITSIASAPKVIRRKQRQLDDSAEGDLNSSQHNQNHTKIQTNTQFDANPIEHSLFNCNYDPLSHNPSINPQQQDSSIASLPPLNTPSDLVPLLKSHPNTPQQLLSWRSVPPHEIVRIPQRNLQHYLNNPDLLDRYIRDEFEKISQFRATLDATFLQLYYKLPMAAQFSIKLASLPQQFTYSYVINHLLYSDSGIQGRIYRYWLYAMYMRALYQYYANRWESGEFSPQNWENIKNPQNLSIFEQFTPPPDFFKQFRPHNISLISHLNPHHFRSIIPSLLTKATAIPLSVPQLTRTVPNEITVAQFHPQQLLVLETSTSHTLFELQNQLRKMKHAISLTLMEPGQQPTKEQSKAVKNLTNEIESLQNLMTQLAKTKLDYYSMNNEADFNQFSEFTGNTYDIGSTNSGNTSNYDVITPHQAQDQIVWDIDHHCTLVSRNLTLARRDSHNRKQLFREQITTNHNTSSNPNSPYPGSSPVQSNDLSGNIHPLASTPIPTTPQQSAPQQTPTKSRGFFSFASRLTSPSAPPSQPSSQLPTPRADSVTLSNPPSLSIAHISQNNSNSLPNDTSHQNLVVAPPQPLDASFFNPFAVQTTTSLNSKNFCETGSSANRTSQFTAIVDTSKLSTFHLQLNDMDYMSVVQTLSSPHHINSKRNEFQ